MHKDGPKAPPPPRETQQSRFIDNAGHMDPKHSEHLRSLSEASVAPPDIAFLPEAAATEDDLAEALGEGTVSSMTSGEQQRFSTTLLDENGLSVQEAVDEEDLDEPDLDDTLDADSDEPETP